MAITAAQSASSPGASQTLGRKLIFIIILVNAALSLVSSGVQLYLEFERDRKEVEKVTTIVDTSFRIGFENALWEYNFELVQALITGVFNKADVQHVKLVTPLGRTWEEGDASAPDLMFDTLDFSHETANGTLTPVGQLTIGLTLANAKARVWAQLWTLILSNFAKTALASVIMLLVFNQFVTRHLQRISSHVAHTSWLERDDALVLDRKESDASDELGQIAEAINTAQSRSVAAHQTVVAEVQRRTAAEQALAIEAEKLARTNARLIEANREQAEFTYAISHDLKAPVNTTLMLLNELMKSEPVAHSAEARELIQLSQQTSRRMSKQVEDILLYSRTVGEEVEHEAVHLTTLMSHIIADLQADIAAASAHLDIGELPVVFGNTAQIRMLFQNLIANAIKFRHRDSALTIKVQSAAGDDVNSVRLSVSDNGIGIAEEFHEKVFGLFQRLHGHQAYSGSGIGLTLCKRIVNNHGGTIVLDSSTDTGSTFSFCLRTAAE